MRAEVLAPSLSEPRVFTEEEHSVWGEILRAHRPNRDRQLHPIFMEGLASLEMDSDRIPDLERVNRRLEELTGWRGVFVKGFEDPRSFYPLLAERRFPIGHFVRSRNDLSYTPEPDIVHDFYGHLPFLADPAYAEFCQALGALACEHIRDPERFREFERVFWYGVEFPLIKTPHGVRIFGAGIASSVGECAYALGTEPVVDPFDVDVVRRTEFRIDEMQKRIFLLESPEQLYRSLSALRREA